MTKGDSLGDRMKMYESATGGGRLNPLLPTFARLDGKAFHSFTHGLNRPYDIRLTSLMQYTTKHLMEETNALMGYTQSDEITLMWYSNNPDSQIFFDGRVFKMTSILASMCSVYFNSILPQYLPEKAKSKPLFDCRVWIVPNEKEEEERTILIAGTGHTITEDQKNLIFIGTVKLAGGSLIYHVFEVMAGEEVLQKQLGKVL